MWVDVAGRIAISLTVDGLVTVAGYRDAFARVDRVIKDGLAVWPRGRVQLWEIGQWPEDTAWGVMFHIPRSDVVRSYIRIIISSFNIIL